MFQEMWKANGPRLVRYFLISAASVLATRGLISHESATYISGQVDTIVGLVMGVVTVVYGMMVAPSSIAQEAARQIDKTVIPAVTEDAEQMGTSAAVVVKTPAGQPDVVVPVT